MGIPGTTRAKLAEHLSFLGVQKGMKLAVHARLLSFGRIEGGLETVFGALCDAVGEEGTLTFPTYTFYLDAQTVYDPAITPSQEVGLLPEYVRQKEGVHRTLCPMHGHAVFGPASEIVLAADYTRSLGPSSSFAAMNKAGFHLLLLGCTFLEGATYLHHIEAEAGVPYREWLALRRLVRFDDGTDSEIILHHYGLPAGNIYRKNFSVAERQMTLSSAMRSVAVAGRFSHFMHLKDLHGVVAELLSINPYALVVGPDNAS